MSSARSDAEGPSLVPASVRGACGVPDGPLAEAFAASPPLPAGGRGAGAAGWRRSGTVVTGGWPSKGADGIAVAVAASTVSVPVPVPVGFQRITSATTAAFKLGTPLLLAAGRPPSLGTRRRWRRSSGTTAAAVATPRDFAAAALVGERAVGVGAWITAATCDGCACVPAVAAVGPGAATPRTPAAGGALRGCFSGDRASVES